ncbi:MAG TPA: DEAD/DEAH box helicase family protein [Candidatus Saccharimonadales bacterium]|nr:DEAD/DEAH box helicase family protein [Candidatus Saccharimonadales bacterium]
MSEHPNSLERHPLADMLQGASYIVPAQHILGIGDMLPSAVQEAVASEIPPEDMSWQGVPVWQTSYRTALRAIATARREERKAALDQAQCQAKTFNQAWHEKYLSKPSEALTRIVDKHAFQSQVRADEAIAGRQLRLAVFRAARNVLLANAITRPDEIPSTVWADREGPRANLQRYFSSVLRWFALSPPRQNEKTSIGREAALSNTLVLIAPTGSGKTMVGGDYLARARVGEMHRDGSRRRAVWVTISQALITDCLNEQKTLQRCLGENVATTAIWEGSKDTEAASGDVVCVTMQSLEEALDEGLLNPEDFDTLVFDEAHVTLTTRMVELLKKFDCQKILMTATPSRSERRSLMRDYHFVRPMGRREAVERGLLSPLRSLTHYAESMEHAEHLAALAAVHLFIKNGKKASIYCQPGNNNAQARRVADLINVRCKEMLDNYDETLSYAEMIGSARSDSPESIARFEQQAHGGVRTTCQMLGIGWDYPELDGAIWIGPQGDLVALEQESGRPLRPKADGREAILVEITTPFNPEGKGGPRYCIAQTLGLENILGAEVVLHSLLPRDARFSESPGTAASGGSLVSAGVSGGGADWGSSSGGIDLLPDLRNTLIAPGTSIIEIVIAPDNRERYVPPPEFATTASSIARQYNLPLSYVHYHLERRPGMPDVRYKLIRRLPFSQDAEGIPGYERYYHSEDLAVRLQRQPMPAVSAEQIFSKAAIAKALHIPETMVNDAITTLELPARAQVRASRAYGGRGSKPVPRYTMEELTRIAEWVERVPAAEPDEVMCKQVIEQYPFAANYIDKTDRVRKRHPASSDRKGIDYFISAAVFQRVEAEHVRRTQMGLVPLRDVAGRAGVTMPVLTRALTDSEKAAANANRFTPAGDTKHIPHVSSEMAEAIIRRVRPRGLKPDEVTFIAMLGRIDVIENTLRQFLQGRSLPGFRTLPDSPRPVRVFPLSVLAEAEKKYGIRNAPAARSIDYDAIVNDPLAARQVQLEILRIPAAQLDPLPELQAPSLPADSGDSPTMAVASAPAAASLKVVFAPPSSTSAHQAASPLSPQPGQGESGPLAPAGGRYGSAGPWAVIERVYTELHCSPAALSILLQDAQLSSEALKHEEERLSGIHERAMPLLHAQIQKLRLAQDRWGSLSTLAHRLGRPVPTVAEQVRERFRLQRGFDWALARSTLNGIDIYFNPNLYGRIYNALRSWSSVR